MNGTFPPESLEAVAINCWQRLRRGSKDRRHGFHNLTLGNVSADGQLHQRIMVLRHVDRQNAILRFHTDVRSGKSKDIANSSAVSLLAYDERAKIQLRLTGSGWIEQDGETADMAWDKATLYARRCYLAEPAPGSLIGNPTSGLPTELEGIKPTEEESEAGRQNFCILRVSITSLEWLYLAHTGHRRAIFHRNEDGEWNGNWMVP